VMLKPAASVIGSPLLETVRLHGLSTP